MRNSKLKDLTDLLCDKDAGLKNVKFFIPSGIQRSSEEIASDGYQMILAGRDSLSSEQESLPPRVAADVWTSHA